MARKKKRKYRRRQPTRIKLKPTTIFSIIAVVLFVFAGLIVLSFGQQAVVLNPINALVVQYFGLAGYILPFVLIIYAFFFFGGKWFLSSPHVAIGTSLVFGVLVVLSQAGSVGEESWVALSGLVSTPGAFLLLIGALIVGIAVLFNTSLDQLAEAFVDVLGMLRSIFMSVLNLSKPKKDALFAGDNQIKVKDGSQESMVTKDDRQVPIAPVAKKAEKPSTEAELLGTTVVANQQKNGLPFWQYPSVTLLSDGLNEKADRGDLKKNASIIERTLESFGIAARVVEVNLGPAVTQYALEIALGTKLSKITSLSNDLALALAAPTGQIRIEAPIPGRSLLGIEIPNRSLEFVTLKRMIKSETMRKAKSKLTVAFGLDVSGQPLVADLAKMPHTLIAGTTGSGKSVLLNSFICTLLYRTTPQEVKLIMIDPKRVELIGYNGIPHLLTPVIVEKDKILSSLKWAVQEMDRRYKLFAEVGVRNIDAYNELSGFQALPFIVIIIDELADLMMYAASDVEEAIVRIAQMARATGIHLIIATQRPSVDVITGLIKANVPSRIAFNVSSMIDSRVILDMPGAEKLLGRGDMLYIPPDKAKPVRIQGTFVSDKEVKDTVDFLKNKNAPVEYTEEVTTIPVKSKKAGIGGGDQDQLFDEAVQTVCQHDRASASLLQRRLSIGYARAARILDQLEAAGVVGPAEGSKPRDVLIKSAEQYFAQRTATEEAAA